MLELPGLGSQLARLDDAEIVRLPIGLAARGALAGFESVGASGGAVKLIKHLPWREPPAEPKSAPVAAHAAAPLEAAAAEAAAYGPAATHVVYRGIAYAVDADGLVIGREEAAGRRTIVIDDDSGGLSRQHCELALRDGEIKLRDLSRYGTFVNEKRIAGETVLHPADVIRIGSPGAELQVIRVGGPHGA